MDEQSFSFREEARLREKQAICMHPSYKCSLCGVYKDNLFNEYQAQIDVLLLILDHYERTLDIHNIQHPKYYDLLNNGIINYWRTDKIKQYISRNRKTEQLI